MSQELVGYGNANFMPAGYKPAGRADDLNTSSYSNHSNGSRRNRSKERSTIKYIVTDPNDVQFTEQSDVYPTVTHNNTTQKKARTFVPLETPGGAQPYKPAELGVVNTAYEGADEDGITPAARARAERRSRRRERRRRAEQSLSPDTSSEDVVPYLMSQPPKKGIIKDNRNSSQDESMEASLPPPTAEKTYHLKKRGNEDYGFAFRNGKVSVVKDGSEAEHAGLQVGDKIVEVNGVGMEGKDRDEILKTIVRNKKNLILVVLDESFQSDLNESSGSASEFSDSVDRSSGSSVRFQIEGRPATLKPGESVASLDVIPSRQVVNFNPNPQPSGKRHRQRSSRSQQGQRPHSGSRSHQGHSQGHRQHHSGSLNRNSQRRSSGRSRSRSPGHGQRSSSSGSMSRRHHNGYNNNTTNRGSANQAYDMSDEQVTTLDPKASSVITEQPLSLSQYKPQSSSPVNGSVVKSEDVPDLNSSYSRDVERQNSARKGKLCNMSYRTWAALALVFCLPCFPLGAAGYVYASRSNNAYDNNDNEKGRKYGTTAGYFIAACVFLGAMAWLGVIVGVVFAI